MDLNGFIHQLITGGGLTVVTFESISSPVVTKSRLNPNCSSTLFRWEHE